MLIDGTQERARELCRQPGAAGSPSSSTTLREQLGRTPSWREVATAVVAGLATELGTEITEGALPRTAMRRIRSLERHYRSRKWTLRR